MAMCVRLLINKSIHIIHNRLVVRLKFNWRLKYVDDLGGTVLFWSLGKTALFLLLSAKNVYIWHRLIILYTHIPAFNNLEFYKNLICF